MSDFSITIWEKTQNLSNKFGNFPTLNDDSTAHFPALKKVPFLFFLFVQALVPSWVASALPGVNVRD